MRLINLIVKYLVKSPMFSAKLVMIYLHQMPVQASCKICKMENVVDFIYKTVDLKI